MNLKFSALHDARVEEAYRLLQQVGEWLRSQGRKQRISHTAFADYALWQSEQANFVVTQANEIIGLVTRRSEPLVDWPDCSNLGRVSMLRALATHPEYQGQGVGSFAIQQSIEAADHGQAIFLDCVSDSLPDYYAKFGFKPVGRQLRSYPDGESYDITLMKREPSASRET